MDRQHWDARYAATELVWSAEPNGFVVSEVEDLSPGRALDVACGEGRNAIWLADQGWDVTGVDFSEVALDKARHLADARGVTVHWELADVTAYTPEVERFDLVIILYFYLSATERRDVFGRVAAATTAWTPSMARRRIFGRARSWPGCAWRTGGRGVSARRRCRSPTLRRSSRRIRRPAGSGSAEAEDSRRRQTPPLSRSAPCSAV